MKTLIAVAVVLSGCGWKSDGLTRLEELYPTPPVAQSDAGTRVAIDVGTPRCSGFSGTWAVRLVQNGNINPLAADVPWKMVISDYFLAESNGQAMDLRFCDQTVAITPVDLGRSKGSDNFKAAIARTPLHIPIPTDGTFAASNVVWTWGLKGLTAPLTEPLPTKDDFMADPRVWDEDGDGHPGVTLAIVAPMGDRYMVRRAIWSFAPGKLTFDNQWLTGALSAQVSEAGLAATNSFLLTVAPITPLAQDSRYEFRCVGSSYSCAALSRDQAAVFQDAPR